MGIINRRLLYCFYCICRRNRPRGGKRAVFPRTRAFGPDRVVFVRPGDLDLPGKMGRSELRHHVVRQHRFGHVDRVPMRVHGGLDAHLVLDQRRHRVRLQLGLLHPAHRHRQLLHAQPGARRSQRVGAVPISAHCILIGPKFYINRGGKSG